MLEVSIVDIICKTKKKPIIEPHLNVTSEPNRAELIYMHTTYSSQNEALHASFNDRGIPPAPVEDQQWMPQEGSFNLSPGMQLTFYGKVKGVELGIVNNSMTLAFTKKIWSISGIFSLF